MSNNKDRKLKIKINDDVDSFDIILEGTDFYLGETIQLLKFISKKYTNFGFELWDTEFMSILEQVDFIGGKNKTNLINYTDTED